MKADIPPKVTAEVAQGVAGKLPTFYEGRFVQVILVSCDVRAACGRGGFGFSSRSKLPYILMELRRACSRKVTNHEVWASHSLATAEDGDGVISTAELSDAKAGLLLGF